MPSPRLNDRPLYVFRPIDPEITYPWCLCCRFTVWLQTLCSFWTFNLGSGNSLGPIGATALAESLSCLISLEALYLLWVIFHSWSFNGVGFKDPWNTILCTGKGFVHVPLSLFRVSYDSQNNLESAGTTALAGALSCLNSLERLDLECVLTFFRKGWCKYLFCSPF